MNKSPSIWVPKRTLVRARTHDHAMTFDAAPSVAITERGDQRGRSLGHKFTTHDNRTVDSTGAFLIGELERLDPEMNMPLADVQWSRDMPLREDVTVADEVSSYTLTTFASAGSLGTGHGIRNGKAWIGKVSTQIGGVGVDIGKFPQPLTPWALELKFDILELESAAKAGRPIDDQKLEALKLKYQMDIDEQVYAGDAGLAVGGLVNNTNVTNVSNVPVGASTTSPWSTKTPLEILADVNAQIISTWTASGYAVMPKKLLLPPTQFGYISTTLISSAGNTSILKYLLENNVLVTSGKGTLEILPAKWLIGAGSGGTLGTSGTVDRMVMYTQDKKYIRFPMTMLQRTPVQFAGLYHTTTYYCKLGVVEVPYPETISYRDGI